MRSVQARVSTQRPLRLLPELSYFRSLDASLACVCEQLTVSCTYWYPGVIIQGLGLANLGYFKLVHIFLPR